MIKKENISGIILAGGKSSRMGTDKGFILLNNKSFIEHIIEVLKPLVSDIIIIADNPDYDLFGIKREKDLIKDAGPLAGLYTGLYHSKTDYNIVLSCDIPLLNESILNALISNASDIYDVVQLEIQGKTIPLIALYNKECINTCFELLNEGERRLRMLPKRCNTKTIAIDSEWEKYAININTIDELNSLRHEFEH